LERLSEEDSDSDGAGITSERETTSARSNGAWDESETPPEEEDNNRSSVVLSHLITDQVS